MLIATQHLLAEGDIPIKLIVGVVFFIIWAISQVITAATKPKDKINPQGEVMLPPAAPTPRQTGSKVRASRQAPAMPQQQPRQQSKQQSRQQQQPVARKKGPPPLRPVVQQMPPKQQAEVVSNIMGSVVSTRPIAAKPKVTKSEQGPNPHQRLLAILRPANLQKDFILTELLRPPLSMRSENQ